MVSVSTRAGMVAALSAVMGFSGCAHARPLADAAPGSQTVRVVPRGEIPTLPAPYATPSANNGPQVARRPDGATPIVPSGYTVSLWASGLEEPRTLKVAPNGDIFVVESHAGRIRVYRPAKGDYSKPGETFTFAEGLRQPFGLSFYKNWIYVGDTDAVVRFAYTPGQTKAAAEPEKITDLTPGGYNQHWTRDVLADTKRNKIFATVGSKTNDSVEEAPRASILEMNPDGSGRHTYADGIRNPVGIAINPDTGKLWTAVNERDGLGDDVPPDYCTEVTPGAFYGWPYAYIGPHEDPRHKGERPDLVAKAIAPDVLLGAHVAALRVAFNPGTMFPNKGDAFVTEHGSWNRARRSGYKVVRIPVKNGRPAGAPQDFVTGFKTGDDNVWGRPVGLTFLPDGSMLLSEDGNNTLWRVTYNRTRTARK